MRTMVITWILLGGATFAAAQAAFDGAQPAYRGEVAGTYQWVRSNTPNGSCDCFYLNGGDISVAWHLKPQVSAVADVGLVHASDVLGSGQSLTLSAYMVGPRFQLLRSSHHRSHTPDLFAQILLGAAHAGGGAAGAGDGTNTFAARMGGGMDVNLGGGFAARLLQVDYYLTNFANSTNNHQNNLLLSAGLVYRWSKIN